MWDLTHHAPTRDLWHKMVPWAQNKFCGDCKLISFTKGDIILLEKCFVLNNFLRSHEHDSHILISLTEAVPWQLNTPYC